MRFQKGDLAFLNRNSNIGIPKHIGELVEVINTDGTPMYDYRVKLFCNGRIVNVKDNELCAVSPDNPLLMFQTGNKLLYKPTDEECEIVKIDFLYNQLEVRFKDGSCRVERPDVLTLVEQRLENVKSNQELIKLFLSPYKKENTYQIPENLMDEIITELHQRW